MSRHNKPLSIPLSTSASNLDLAFARTVPRQFCLARNAYANSVQSEVTLDDLFRA